MECIRALQYDDPECSFSLKDWPHILLFCVGDRFYLCENKILCEYDYEERLVFANMALHPPPTATLAHIKRQVTHLQPHQ
ncbi:hypothetical protein PV325_000326, partial [Microctonus aethiopoides]